MIILCAFVCLNYIPDKQDDNVIKLHIAIGICFLLTLVYSALCISKNRLPRAKRGSKAVLFVIDAEIDRFYDDVKNKLGSSFSDYINNANCFSFFPVYVRKQSIPQYNFNDEASMIPLLEKTRTMFVVDVKYRVDDITKAENFEIRINLGVVHPDFKDAKNRIISNDLQFVQQTVSKKRFKKIDLLEQFDITAQQLSLTCKYIIGLVLLLEQKIETAYTLIGDSYSLSRKIRSSADEKIFRFIENRFIRVCLIASSYYLDLFSSKKDLTNLEKMNEVLEVLNSIRPGLPEYYSKKAYYEVAKNKDAQAAEKYVTKEKAISPSRVWKYSDAFLAAYTNKSPITIYKKYNNAFKVSYNLVMIADYIEFMIEQEPEKHGLFLAAALVYDELNDKKLANDYYLKYSNYNANDCFTNILQEKIIKTSSPL